MNLDTTNDVSLYLKNMKKMLSASDTKLIIKDTDKKLSSIHENHLGEVLYVWNPVRILIDACGRQRSIQLYIKTYLNKSKKLVVIISFHEYKDYGGN